MASYIQDNFDWVFYVNAYSDLSHINNKNKAFIHYIIHGIKENRYINYNCNNDIPSDFDWLYYTFIYNDLRHLNKEQAKTHYLHYGKNENRIYNLSQCINNYNINYNNEKIIINKINIFLKKETYINILIRTCRKNYFNICLDSINEQTFINKNIIISYDNLNNIEYLTKFNNLTKIFININSPEKYKFNLYCNILMNNVSNGWIIFLDDDNKLFNANSLKIINENIESENDLLIWNFLRPDKIIFPSDLNNIKLGDIDSCSFCFHSKYKHLSIWNDKQYGDYNFFMKLISNNCFNIKYINLVLTCTIYTDKIANYGNLNDIVI